MSEASQLTPRLVTKLYRGVNEVYGSIVVLNGATNVAYNEDVEVQMEDGSLRRGRVLTAS